MVLYKLIQQPVIQPIFSRHFSHSDISSSNMISLHSVRVFEAVARHLSMSEAAQELFVSQSAVSQQIRALEKYVGQPLFVRHRNGLELTKPGEQFFDSVRPAIRNIVAAAKRIKNQGNQKEITISSVPAFGARWLLPRMSQLESELGVTIRLEVSRKLVDFRQRDVDVAIRYGAGSWPNTHATLLCRLHAICVVASHVASETTSLQALLSESALRLLEDAYQKYWETFAAQLRISESTLVSRRLVIDDLNIVIDAVLRGQGIALLPHVLVDPELSSGRLAKVANVQLDLPAAYWLVTHQGNRSPSITQLIEKLVSLAQDSEVRTLESEV